MRTLMWIDEQDLLAGDSDGEVWRMNIDDPLKIAHVAEMGDSIGSLGIDARGRMVFVSQGNAVTVFDQAPRVSSSEVSTMTSKADPARGFAGCRGGSGYVSFPRASGAEAPHTVASVLCEAPVTSSLCLDDREALVGMEDGSIATWSVANSHSCLGRHSNTAITALATDKKQRKIAVLDAEGTLQLYGLVSNDILQPLWANPAEEGTSHVAFAGTDEILISADSGYVVAFRDPTTGRRMYRIAIEGDIRSLAASPSGANLAVAADHYVRIFRERRSLEMFAPLRKLWAWISLRIGLKSSEAYVEPNPAF